MGEAEVRAIGRQLANSAMGQAAAILAPQQLAVGIPGGISILIHCIHLVLHHDQGFVVVKIDLSNAFNTISRAATFA